MNLFRSVKVQKPKRNVFNLSHNSKLTANMGLLYPIFCEPVVPGDTFKGSAQIFLRTAPMIAPMMSRVDIYTHFFFVPCRLLWDKWKDFITGGEDGLQKPLYPVVHLTPNDASVDKKFVNGSLLDYLDYPTFVDPNSLSNALDKRSTMTQSFDIDALPIRAYQLIWNEYYRDENLEQPEDIKFDVSGRHPVTSSFLSLQRRAWHKDYFTSALPWPQRGDDVELPMTGNADINPVLNEGKPVSFFVQDASDSMASPPSSSGRSQVVRSSAGVAAPNGSPLKTFTSGSLSYYNEGNNTTNGAYLGVPKDGLGQSLYRLYADQIASGLQVDLSNVNSATVNELRRAIKAQEFLELDARGGSRYIEQILSHFGVRSSDARLQRPEFLGGGKQPLVVSDVLQTSGTTETSPQANQAGIGASAGRSHTFKCFFEEHGFVIGIMSIIPRASYQQGMPRKYLKRDRTEFYWPTFAHLGEQEIQNKELYFDPKSSEDSQNGVFGYTPRYAEYKAIPDKIHGEFRDSLAFWHLGRIFPSQPNLNGAFVGCDPSNRVFATDQTSADKFWVNIQFNIKALRPMPKFGTPRF